MIIGTDNSGRDIRIQLDRLVESRMLVQANSGAGKSWALRRILEQTHGKIQQLVIDVEDEFHTLREKYDYVLAGRHGGDCPADVRSAPLLARRLLELGASTIMGIYELQAHDRIRFVRLFLESLINAPRDLWHPVLVVVDEAHVFAPQVGEAESAASVIDLMTRGRKRGFCGILATQRISKLHKDAAAEANNKLIGRSALDVDMKRASDELGFSTREQQNSLRTLRPGEFFAFGPAVSDVVTLVKVGPVETTHPKAGQRAAAPPPPREKVRAVLGQLADLPKEAEAEAQTSAVLRRKNAELEVELRKARAAAPAPDPKVTAERESEIRKEAARSVHQQYGEVLMEIAKAADTTNNALNLAKSLAQFVDTITEPRRESRPPAARTPEPAPAPRGLLPRPTRKSSPPAGIRIPIGERSVLTACAQYPDGATREQLSILTGYKRSSRDTYIQRLREKGYVEANDLIVATIEGISALGPDFQPLPTGDKLREYWLQRLPEGERAILEVLVSAFPRAVDRESIDQDTGYKRSSRDTYIQRLKARQLVENVGRGEVRASEVLFE